jgi:signal transduction histidine kinase
MALLAHELRSPLNAVIGYAEAMRAETFGPLNAPYADHAATIHRAALHLLKLVDDMADVAKAEAGVWRGEREVLDPRALADEIIEMFGPRAAAASVRLRTDVAAGLGRIFADRRALAQILINLLDNALKVTARGGEIVVTLSRAAEGLNIVVTDTGGAPDASGGQGLGLRLVRALCALHGGDLTLTPAAEGMVATARLAAIEEP